MALNDWNIRGRARECAKCGKPFEKGDPCRSAVLPFDTDLVRGLFAERLAEEAAAAAAGQAVKPHPEYVRLDFCDACWNALAKGPPWISSWRGVYEPPPEAPEDPLRKADPESLLRSLLEGDDVRNNLAPIYLLAVMLERKRVLVERGARHAPDGTLVRIYEHRRSGDILLVADPRLEPAQIPETQAEIERLLGIARPSAAGAPPPAAPGPAPAAETTPQPAPEPAP